jgi:hypothetical protein
MQINIIPVFLALSFFMFEVAEVSHDYHDLGPSHMDSGPMLFVHSGGNKSAGKLLLHAHNILVIPPEFIVRTLVSPEVKTSNPLFALHDLLPSRASPA